jgi:uncharacterized protein YaaN involved in tellurite resistance
MTGAARRRQIMTEQNTTQAAPVLTLEPDAAPTLTLGVVDESAVPQAPIVPVKEYTEAIIENVQLTPEEKKQVDDFAEQIDIKNSAIILQYGSGAQSKMSNFSESALSSVRAKDMGQVGGMLTSLVSQLRSFDVTEEKGGGFGGFFKKSANKVTTLKAKYATAEKNVAQISDALEHHQVTLIKDITLLDKMYDQNLVYFKELTMYILAGKQKLAEVEANDLPALQDKAKASGLPEDAQAANDLANQCDRFSKKLYDLELTRTIAIQMAPQIRLIQNNDTLMSEKIQSTIVNTIPLWKSQMVLALGVEHSTQAAKAQREVTDMTNELLKKNSEMLKTSTIETAKESERGIVDIETLQTTNKNLIESLDEVVRIQTEGRAKRAEAEQELTRIEGELKNKLLELRG